MYCIVFDFCTLQVDQDFALSNKKTGSNFIEYNFKLAAPQDM